MAGGIEGAKAGRMTAESVKVQLESLLSESRYMTSFKDSDDVFQADAEALEEVLNILHDYELLSKRIGKDDEHFHIAAKPVLKDGIWLCPKCRKRVRMHHTYCHWCGKKMGWHK